MVETLMWSAALWCRHVVIAGEECWGLELGRVGGFIPCAAGEEDASGGADCVPCVFNSLVLRALELLNEQRSGARLEDEQLPIWHGDSTRPSCL
jgi:hypothetical protein